MNVSVEHLDGHMAKLTIEVEASVFDKAIDDVYKKQRGKINVPGFRKGKAPRVIIEKMYGPEVFFEDAAELCISEQYPNAYDESGLEIVSRPEIDIVQLAKDKPFIFSAQVALRPDVELGKYNGVTVTRIDTTVTDEKLQEEIDRVLKNNGRYVEVDRPVEKDDQAVIDYVGRVDGEEFEGGTANDYHLTIGSNTFIEGFEDQIIGHSIGETFDVNVTFPEEYHAPDLAGQPAVFTVTIKGLRSLQVPELNDEYVQDTSEFETVAEYKEDVKKRLSERLEREAKRTKQDEAIEKIVKNSKMDIPEAMIETQVDRMMNDYANGLMNQGIPVAQYFQMTGMTPELLREQMTPTAKRQIESSLVLEEIAKAEGFTATDEDVEEKVKEMSSMYMMDADELMGRLTDDEKRRMKKEIEVEKAAEFISDNLKERAKPKKKSEEESKED